MGAGTANIGLARPPRRVAFTCDFLRFEPGKFGYESFQPRNLAWLKEVLTGASAWAGEGIEVTSVMPPFDLCNLERALGSPAALAEYRESSDHAWARRYDARPDVFASVFEQLCDHDLVVGFEMAPTIRRELHAAGARYINFYVHPLRYLRDLCLGATTNAPDIAVSLAGHAIPNDEVESQTRRFRALFLRQQLASCAIPSGLPVLIGQTEHDSVLIRDGRFAGWEDFADELDELLSGHDEIVFLEHPYRRSSDAILEYLRSVHGKTVITTNANGYGIIFSNSLIPKVITLSSSLGVEASTLGIPTHFLLSDPRRKLFLEDIEVDSMPALGHGVLLRSFWNHILNSVADIEPHQAFGLGENYLRSALDAWSFRPLQNGLSGMTNRKSVLPSATLTDDRSCALLAALTSFSPLEHETTPESVERAAAVGVELRVLDHPIRTGERQLIRLGGIGPVPVVGAGFHAPENWGIWSKALFAELCIAVTQGPTTGRTQLRISLPVRIYEGLLPQCPVMRITANNVEVGYAMFRASTTNRQTLQFAIDVTGPLCKLGLELSGLESPSSGPNPHDVRWLGIGLSDFEVEHVSIDSTEKAPVPSSDNLLLWGMGGDVLHVRSHDGTMESGQCP